MYYLAPIKETLHICPKRWKRGRKDREI